MTKSFKDLIGGILEFDSCQIKLDIVLSSSKCHLK